MNNKEEFLSIYKKYIRRDGSDKFLDFLLSSSSDFFVTPASTKYHCAYEGGLLIHSLNVFRCLNNYLLRERVKGQYRMSYDNETIAITSLLHDVCKINCYKKGSRNVKDEKGTWQVVPVFEYEDELPYGHGEKSVYIISEYMKLTREEAFAIRYHMGFSGTEDKRWISDAFKQYPLVLALCIADMEATYFIESM